MKISAYGSLATATIFSVLAVISSAAIAASLIGAGISGQDSTSVVTAALRIDDNFPDDGPTDIPPGDVEPEPPCAAGSRVYTVNNSLLDSLALLLGQSRVQISHTRQGEPLVGEPRTLDLARGITTAKYQQLESARERICREQPDPVQCMADWYRRMTETVVHTIEPKYYSYVDWDDGFANLTGLSFTPVPVPIVEKPVQSSLTKALTSALILPIAINVDKARCHINQIESVVTPGTHPVDIRNGRLEIGFPLQSGGYPTLKCEGRAVALWGLHTWGWADELFPDVSLTNMRLNASFGGFSALDKLPMYSFVNVDVQADVDLNNIPGAGEAVISFFKDYSSKARNKVAKALRKKLMEDSVREAFGRALVDVVEKKTGDRVARVCDVRAAGGTVDIEYEIRYLLEGYEIG